MPPARRDRGPRTGPAGDPVDRDAICTGCGYSLRGMRTGQPCPECGRPIPDRAPPPRPLGEVIDQDLNCLGCGYNLKGLRITGRCPECGRAISGKSRRPAFAGDDTLTDAPVGYLRFLAAGCFLMMAGSIATLFLLRRAWLLQSQAWSLVAAAAAILWLLGVFITTEPRRSSFTNTPEARRAWRKTRWAIRVLFLAWPAAALAVFIGIRLHIAGLASMNAGLGPGASVYAPHADAAAGILALIGIAASIPLCLLLTDLADWARNETLGERFRTAAWALTAGGVVIVLCRVFWGKLGPLNFVAVVAQVFGIIAFIGGLFLMLASQVQLAFTALWAIRNADEAGRIEERRAERRAREFERDLAAIKVPSLPVTTDPAAPPAPRPPRQPAPPRHGPVRERPAEVDAYELEPDDDPPGPR